VEIRKSKRKKIEKVFDYLDERKDNRK